MHLDDADSALLKTWVVKQLEDISDADSDVLADYVLALIKSDEADDQVKQNCLDNLDDFLKEHTAPFVEKVLQAIKTKSYDPSRPSVSSFAPTAPAFVPAGPANGSAAYQSQGPGANAFNQPSLKRSFQEEDGGDGHYGQGQRGGRGRGGDRPMKQLRRGGRGYDQRGGRNAMPSHIPNLPPGMPPFDPNNPLGALLAMQAMGFPMPGMPGMPQVPFAGSPPPHGAAVPKRTGERCEDYDTKGFCALGASCPYEHGNDHIVMPQNVDEYDPSNAYLNQDGSGRGQDFTGRGRGRGRGRGDRGRGDRGRGDRGAFRGARGGRAEFSSSGPNHDRSVTSVVVEQIPEERFNEDSVREFFSEFGNIEEVTLQSFKRLAIIKYDDYEGSKRAYDSPKVIFDNRFVKVYWYKPDKLPRPHNGYQNGGPGGRNEASGEDVEMGESEEKIDPVEFAKKQEEAQRAHEEKQKQKEAALKQRQELEEKMKAQAEERSKLLAKLAAKERAKSGTPDLSAQLAIGGSNGDIRDAKTTSQTDALKAKLAELEKTAVSMGINPNEESNQGFSPRGRGGYRGRGAWQPRGAWRGRGGFAPRGGGVMRLDNRPRRVAVIFPGGEEMGAEKDEALKQYLLFSDLMESAEIASHPDRKDAALVAFTERYKAEQFYGQAKDIPHIGKVELAWVANAPSAAPSATAATGATAPATGTATSAKQGYGDKDVKMDEGQDGARPDVDYDVADDDDRWLVG